MKKATDSAKELAALLKKTKTTPSYNTTAAIERGEDVPIEDLKSEQAKDERALKMAKARAVMNAFDHVRQWVSDPYESSTETSYITMIHGDGKVSCNCPGWVNYSGGTEKRPFRRCKHQDRAVRELGLEGKRLEPRPVGKDVFLYVIQ